MSAVLGKSQPKDERTAGDPVAVGAAISSGKGRIDIEGLSVAFGRGATQRLAIDAVSLSIVPGQFVCLLGPSGCGKSTVLNSIAGYVQPTAGRVSLDGAVITRPGPDRGMVFQQYSLFPWKTVAQNVEFGPLMAGKPAQERARIVSKLLDMVALRVYADKYPSALSGGMQQRIGLARALASAPSVLLMDEPFGALDAQTRVIMQENLLGIWGETRNTVLFVTHDIDEAIFLADRVIVMSASPGRIIADIAVDLSRPRTMEQMTSEEFLIYKRHCMEWIRKEALKAFEKNNGAR